MKFPAFHRIAGAVVAGAFLVSLTGCALFGHGRRHTGSDEDLINGTPLPERREGASFMDPSTDRSRFSPVRFAFDSYAIPASEAGKLDEVAHFMKGRGREQLIIAGFTDERGTEEYNRGLGEKRAGAVRSWLLDHGADTNRIQTTSFGLEMPVDASHNEAAWAKNRRAEFGVTQ